MRLISIFSCAGLVVAAACSSSTRDGFVSDPSVIPASTDIAATWVQAFPNSIPGNFLGFTLADSAGHVTGKGRWAGEAGPSGSVIANGRIDGTSVHLDLVFTYEVPSNTTPPRTATFDGTLSSSYDLVGKIVEAGFTRDVHFVRAVPLSQAK